MKRIRLLFRSWVFLLMGLAPVLPGCGGASPPQPADAAQAREARRLALEAWQKGASPNSLQGHQPPIQVVDHEWRKGVRLVRYRVGEDAPLGADLRCQVVLSLQNGHGTPHHKKAVYSVGTHPVLTVVREEDP